MYIRNVIRAYQDLKDGEVLVLGFRSGNQCNIKIDDSLEKVDGDLIFSRTIGKNKRSVIFVDVDEVEIMFIKKEWI